MSPVDLNLDASDPIAQEAAALAREFLTRRVLDNELAPELLKEVFAGEDTQRSERAASVILCLVFTASVLIARLAIETGQSKADILPPVLEQLILGDATY